MDSKKFTQWTSLFFLLCMLWISFHHAPLKETSPEGKKPELNHILQNQISIIEKKESSSLLVQHAKKSMDANNMVVLLYASYSYRDTLFNWLVSFQLHSGDPSQQGGVLVICLDQALQDFLRTLKWDCYLYDFLGNTNNNNNKGSLDKNTVKSLWVTRSSHVLELLESGVSVVLTDTDAVWLKDIRPLLLSDSGNVVSSRANFPYNSPWGTTLCMGLIFFRSSPEVVALAQLGLKETIVARDDQIGFNRVLFKLKADQPFENKLSPDGNEFARARFLLSPGKSIHLTLLPHNVVARLCHVITEWEKVYVAHCHIHDGVPALTSKNKGNAQSHTQVLVKYHSFFLVDDWEARLSVAAGHHFSTFGQVLQDISN